MSGKIGAQDLAKLCYSSDVTQSTENQHEYHCDYFTEFYSSKADNLEEWVKQGLIPLEDMPHLMKVYKCSNITKPEHLLEEFENHLMEHCKSITTF